MNQINAELNKIKELAAQLTPQQIATLLGTTTHLK